MLSRGAVWIVLAACGSAGAPPTPAAPAPAPAPRPAPHESIAVDALVRDVAWLCDPARAGRGAYQPGGAATADWIAAAFSELGFEVVRQAIAGGGDNVIGVLRGDERAVVVSAHYDHMGVDGDGVVYPGADDNASGVAVMLAVARAVADRRPRHTLVFIGFGAEEHGLRGSDAYVHDPAWPLRATIAAINFDMVGRNLFEYLGGGRAAAVGVVGLEASEAHRAIAHAAAEAEGTALLAGSARFLDFFGFDGRTDDWWFREMGVKTIHFSTGLHRDYHRATDTPDRLRPDQMLRVARLATRIVAELAQLSE